MMASDETQAFRALQKEQEREQRRLRDRQRRQSMTVEERERHLARRRRNYQLRRQRTGAHQLDSPQKQMSSMNRGEVKVKIESQAADVLSGGGNFSLDVSCAVGVPSGLCIKDEENDLDVKRAMLCEALGGEVANFPRRLRVKQVRHLARLLNSPPIGVPSDGNQLKAEEQSITRNSESTKQIAVHSCQASSKGSEFYHGTDIRSKSSTAVSYEQLKVELKYGHLWVQLARFELWKKAAHFFGGSSCKFARENLNCNY